MAESAGGPRAKPQAVSQIEFTNKYLGRSLSVHRPNLAVRLLSGEVIEKPIGIGLNNIYQLTN